MENSNTATQTQGPPTEAMVEAAARAMREAAGDSVGYNWRYLARLALIAGIAAALKRSDS